MPSCSHDGLQPHRTCATPNLLQARQHAVPQSAQHIPVIPPHLPPQVALPPDSRSCPMRATHRVPISGSRGVGTGSALAPVRAVLPSIVVPIPLACDICDLGVVPPSTVSCRVPGADDVIGVVRDPALSAGASRAEPTTDRMLDIGRRAG